MTVPVRMDNGKIVRFEGYRVQHSTMRGPAKGGIRFQPNVTVVEVRALATWPVERHYRAGRLHHAASDGVDWTRTV